MHSPPSLLLTAPGKKNEFILPQHVLLTAREQESPQSPLRHPTRHRSYTPTADWESRDASLRETHVDKIAQDAHTRAVCASLLGALVDNAEEVGVDSGSRYCQKSFR